MENNAELEMAWELVEKTGSNIFLTGKAGTGKTTFLRQLRQNSPKRMVVLAPTGIAAINAGGSTIHSFFQLSTAPYVPGSSIGKRDSRKFQFAQSKRRIIRTLDLLVIDEISMVRADLLDAVDSVMRRYRDHDKPFGGVQLLLIGDLQQLAPVAKDDEWELLRNYYRTPFFFSSHALNTTHYVTIELQRIYRQSDLRFTTLLNNIRNGRADDATLAALNARYMPDFKPDEADEWIRLTTHNRQAQEINERQLAQLGGRSYTFKAQIKGTFPESAYPAEQQLTLKEGAQVMFLKNATDHSYYNGMIGRVVYVDQRTVKVRDKASGRVIDLAPADWTNSRYAIDERSKEITEKVEGVFIQYPLRLAWAITIHKSQGLTFERAIIDASRSFAHGQAYVALSRCKSLEGMVLNAPLTRQAIINDSTVSEFISHAEAQRPTAATLTALQREYTVQTLDDMFATESIRQAMEMVVRTLTEHYYNRAHALLIDYAEARKTVDALAIVGTKFAAQYRAMIADGHTTESPQLQDRIQKGAEYFARQLKPLAQIAARTKMPEGNKQAKAQIDERQATLLDELKLKIGMLEYEALADTTFSTSDYLRQKARLLLGGVPEKGRPSAAKSAATMVRTAVTAVNTAATAVKTAATMAKTAVTTANTAAIATPRAPQKKATRKPDTRRVSHDMFTRGMTVEQIAKERQLAVGTVFGHLERYVIDGSLPIDQLVTQEHVDMIRNYAAQHPDVDRLTPVKEALGDDVGFEEIRLVYNVYGLRPEKKEGE